MLSGPTEKRRIDYSSSNSSSETTVPKTLQSCHGITMKNPTEVSGSSRSMLLNMLMKLSEFIKLAEALMDNLKGKSSPDEKKGPLRQLSDTPLENAANTQTLKKEPSPFNSFERSQARLHTIPVVAVSRK